MNIVLLSRRIPTDINFWSGTLYYIYHKLKEKHNVEVFGSEVLLQLELFKKGNISDSNNITPDKYIRNLNRLLSERINAANFDLIFLGDIFFVPFLDINIPYILLSDTTYEQNVLHYRKPDKSQYKSCIRLERLMIEKTFKIIYCSEWVKNRAVEVYKIDPNKIEVVEFGANIPTPQNYSIDIAMDICRLIFIGKKWKDKGGDKLLQAYKQLKSEGFPCTLTIIGSTPEDEQEEDENLTIIPFLDKSKKEDLEKLCKILSESHFLVLPTRFDAFGIVFSEASAYALPSIAADVGGVSQAVREGKIGYLLPPDATANDYAEKIKTVFNDKENYLKLRQSSRREFETRLNWDVWGEKVNKILENAVKEWNQFKKS